MTAAALVIGLLLTGQVSPPNGRYSGSGGEQPATPANRGAVNGVAPLTDPSRSGEQRPAAGANDPYSGQTNPPDRGGQRSYPLGGAGTAPATSPPPPFRGLEEAAEASPAQSPGQPVRGLKPAAMMQNMLSPPAGSQLTGESVRLIEVVSGAPTRLEQTERVEAYWDLCSSVADYYLGLREQEELRRLRSISTGGNAVWQQAEAEMTVRMDTSLRAARTAQLRIAGWRRSAGGALPLPEDLPHCGSYHSRYEEIFAGRPAAEAQELAALLPLRYAEIKGAAAAVTRAEEWLATVARNESGEGTGTLRALEFLALRRRAFVQIARDYNRRIARYTELASPGEIGAERLIGMLIKTESTSTATRPGTTGRQSSNATDAPPRTFADGQDWEPAGGATVGERRDDKVRPVSGESPAGPRRERSLLVSPR